MKPLAKVLAAGQLFLLLFLLIARQAETAEAVPEYQVKAAFILNFTKFIEWPAGAFADSKAPVVLGVVGQDPFGGYLDQMLTGKQAQGRQLQLKKIEHGGTCSGCHLLFISSSEAGRIQEILRSVGGGGTVTISDIPDFESQGGTIRLFITGQRVRFAINTEAPASASVKFSSQLLKLSQTSEGS
jgi:hypothetical protein